MMKVVVAHDMVAAVAAVTDCSGCQLVVVVVR